MGQMLFSIYILQDWSQSTSLEHATHSTSWKGRKMLDSIFSFIQGAFLLVAIVVVAVVGLVFARARYKIPNADQALVITGSKKKGMRVLPGSGSFVSPWQKHQFFPLGVMTVRSDDQETQSSTLVPVIVQWTAQLRADVDTEGARYQSLQQK